MRSYTPIVMIGYAPNVLAVTSPQRIAIAPELPTVVEAAPSGGTPSEPAAFHKADYDKWGAVMARAGINKN